MLPTRPPTSLVAVAAGRRGLVQGRHGDALPGDQGRRGGVGGSVQSPTVAEVDRREGRGGDRFAPGTDGAGDARWPWRRWNRWTWRSR